MRDFGPCVPRRTNAGTRRSEFSGRVLAFLFLDVARLSGIALHCKCAGCSRLAFRHVFLDSSRSGTPQLTKRRYRKRGTRLTSFPLASLTRLDSSRVNPKLANG